MVGYWFGGTTLLRSMHPSTFSVERASGSLPGTSFTGGLGPYFSISVHCHWPPCCGLPDHCTPGQQPTAEQCLMMYIQVHPPVITASYSTASESHQRKVVNQRSYLVGILLSRDQYCITHIMRMMSSHPETHIVWLGQQGDSIALMIDASGSGSSAKETDLIAGFYIPLLR